MGTKKQNKLLLGREGERKQREERQHWGGVWRDCLHVLCHVACDDILAVTLDTWLYFTFEDTNSLTEGFPS